MSAQATEGQDESNRAPVLLRRLGLTAAPADFVFSWRVVGTLLLIYALFFAFFYPRVATNHDEANYIRQARLVLQGTATVEQLDAFTGEAKLIRPSTYPMGTALMAAPLVAVGGWRASFLVPCLCLLALIGLTALWMQEEKYPPVFAVLMLGFPAVLVLGRVVMSDVPSGAWVALGMLLFWHGRNRGAPWWIAAGFVAGASMILRVTNPILFVPLFAGTVLRREKKAIALVVGGMAGLGLRALTMQWFFGSALFERSAYHFAPETLDERLPLYLLGLLVFIPGGLVFSLLYRGERRPEIVITIAGFFIFFLFQTYSTVETSPVKRIILALRYLIPVLPLMVFAMAESVPRLWSGFLATRDGPTTHRLQLVGTLCIALWLGGIATACIGVHPYFAGWSATQADVRDEIDRVLPDDVVLVTNFRGTKKFLRELDRRFQPVTTEDLPAKRVTTLLERHGEVFVVLFDRSDSKFWRAQQGRNDAFIEALETPAELLSDINVNDNDRLRIWRMRQSGASG